jgi:hypothetical protein
MLANKRRNKKFNEYAQKLEIFNAKLSKMKADKQKKLDDKKRKRIGKEKAAKEKKKDKLFAKKQIARYHKMKANEINFLMMLQKEAKKRELDEKLEETRKRKNQILENIRTEKKEKRKLRKLKFEKKKETNEKFQNEMKKKYQGKMGRAKKLRNIKLKERAKIKGSEKK